MKYIPEDFYIFSKLIKTTITTEDIEMRDYKGAADVSNGDILLNLDHETCDEDAEQTYIHEVVHTILLELGYEELGHDEKFVDHLAKGFHQFMCTSGIWQEEEMYSCENDEDDLVLDPDDTECCCDDGSCGVVH